MDDDTVRLPAFKPPTPEARPAPTAPKGSGKAAPPPPASSRRGIILAGGAAAILAAAGGAAWVFWPRGEATVTYDTPPQPERVSAAPEATRGPPLVTEAEILELYPTEPRTVRLRDAPRVFVMLFPDLDSQGAALNRVAALIEKRGLPRDRVLSDAELASAITASGSTPATYYYGHNYRGSDLEHFFTLADRQGVRLNATEAWLREQLAMARSLGHPLSEVAFISVPGIDDRVDARMRRAILRHESGHGYFYTNPVFAAHVTRVWRRDFTPADRAAMTAYLARGGYDPDQEELMVNETMAYLLFTPDERFFSAAEAGLTQERLDAMRRMLLEAAPPVADLK